MSQWTPWASGRAGSRRPYTQVVGAGGSDQYFWDEVSHTLHLITKDENARVSSASNTYKYSNEELSALLGKTTVVDVIEEPSFFGQSKPNSISCIYKSFIEDFSEDMASNPEGEGSARIWLYRDAVRSSGVYAEISEGLSDLSWDQSAFAVLPGAIMRGSAKVRYMLLRWGTSDGQVGERSLDCLPTVYPYREVTVSDLVRLRSIGYSLDGPYIYNYATGSVFGVPLQLSVLQYPGDSTATAVVHDYSSCGFVYAFDSGLNFIPDGQSSPVTFGQVSVTRGEAYTWNGQTVTPISPAISHLDINRRTINPSREYAHSPHYPKAGQKKWGFYMARLPRRPSNAAATYGNDSPSAPQSLTGHRLAAAIPFHSSAFSSERDKELAGLFGAPDSNPVGHWTILPDDNALVDGDVSVKIEHSPGDDAAANFAMQYTNTAFSAAFGYWLECGKADPQSRTLTHNCAQGSNSAVDLAAPQTVWVSLSSSAAWQPSSSLAGYSPQLTQPALPDISGLADVVFSAAYDLDQTFGSIAAAIASESMNYTRYLSSGGTFSETIPTNPFRRGELVFTLEKVQWFARVYYPSDEKENATWAGPGLPDAGDVVSETLAYIDAGAERSIPVSTQRLRVDLLGMYVGRFDIRNYETFWRAYEQSGTGFKFTNSWTPGPAIPEARFCHRDRKFVQASYLMTKAETANFKNGAEVTVPSEYVRNITELSFDRRGVMYSDFLESRPAYSNGFPGGYPLTVSVKLQ